jgi:drug/metabolite transporter (DMT)-like permease
MTALFGLLAAFTWATMNIPLQRNARRMDQRVMLFWILVFGTGWVIVAALVLEGTAGPFGWRSLLVPALAAVASNAAFLCMSTALKKGNISVVIPIMALEGGIAVVFSIALGERPGPLTLLMIAIAVVGTVLVSWEPGGETRTAKGAVWAIVAACGYAVMLVALAHTDQQPITSAAIMRVVATITAVPLLLMVRQTPSRAMMPSLVLTGVLDALAIGFFAVAAALGPSSVASVSAAQFGTAAALIAIVFLRERLRTTQYVGVAVTMVAVSGLALVG